MSITYPAGREVITQVLPHRPPFLWLSRVLACEPGASVTAELDVDPDLPLFQGHFPDYPVLPGVIIMEALAQAASFCLLIAPELQGSLGFFAGIDKAKFRHQVKPGDVLTLEAEIVKFSHRLAVADVTAKVGDAICATATQKYVLAKAETLESAPSSTA